MIRVIIVLLAAIASAALLDFGGLVGKPVVLLRVTDPVRQPSSPMQPTAIEPGMAVLLPLGSGKGLEVRILTRGWAFAGALTIAGEGGPIYLEATERDRFGRNLANCMNTGADGWICRIALRTVRPDVEIRMIYAEGGSAVIRSVTYEAATARRLSAVSGNVVVGFLLLLIFVGPILGRLSRTGVARDILLIALGGVFLLAAGPISLLAVIALAVLGYVAIRAVEAATSDKARKLTASLLLVVLAVLAAKILL